VTHCHRHCCWPRECRRLFRVYAHVYCSHFDKIVALGAEAHLNTAFKRARRFCILCVHALLSALGALMRVECPLQY
jgi:hypothetical protein